jgi:hypothetical protein
MPIKNPAPKDLSKLEYTITSKEVFNIIQKTKDSSAPGHDGVSYKYISRLNQLSPSTLPLLYNTLLKYNMYLSAWKQAMCAITPKKGKSSYLVPSAYRPISLLSCISKLMEATLEKQIEKDALICGALSPNHMGGISQTSAIDAFIATLNLISDSFYPTRSSKTIQERYLAYPSLLCMDIQGAFNAKSTKTFACIMEARKMPDYQIKWVKTIGQDRQLSFPFDDKIESSNLALKVFLQGSLSSPTLFVIMAAAIREIPPPTTCPPSGIPESK